VLPVSQKLSVRPQSGCPGAYLGSVLGTAAWRRDHGVRPYAAALASSGLLIACYHVLVERFPALESSACEPTNPCTPIWVRRFGYLTIPTMALSAFVLLLVLLAVAGPSANNHLAKPASRRTASGPTS
jgi:disulfide bond formation protein DsbB